MSKGGGGGGSTTSVQKADPWTGLQPALTKLYGSALSNYDSGGPQYYPGKTLADPNWNINHALDLGGQIAGKGAPNVGAAQDLNYGTLRGDYLNHNPNLDAMYKSATDPLVEQFKNATAPALASQFSLAGRMGSGAHDAAMGTAENSLGRGLASASAQIYGGNYEAERARQQQAMLMAPQLDQAAYDPANKFLQMGQFQQSQAQDAINADRQRFDFGQNAPTMNLQTLNQLLQGGAAYTGQTKTGSESLNRNPFNSALGGAATGASIGSIVPGLGTGLGALIGGLGAGLFG